MIQPIKNINNLKTGNNCGIYKQWIYKTSLDYHKACDYVKKISYSIQDLNREIDCLNDITAKELIYIISLVDWIKEAFGAIKRAIADEIIKDFTFTKQDELDYVTEYLKAVHSFIVAHPLTTDRHKKFGLDGNFICLDISSNLGHSAILLVNHMEYFYHLDFNGLKEKTYDESDNFYMISYSQKDDGMRYQRIIGSKVELIYKVAELYIEALYELDKYLSKQKRADFEGKIKRGGKS